MENQIDDLHRHKQNMIYILCTIMIAIAKKFTEVFITKAKIYVLLGECGQ